MFRLSADGLAKRFGHRKIFSNLSFELSTGQSMAIVGPNGSGKTTLLLLLLGQYRPNRGDVQYRLDDQPLEMEYLYRHAALVSPYLHFYDHLSAEENMTFFATVSGGSVSGREINELLTRVGLESRGNDLFGIYSSGMKQRLKYAVALMKQPDILFLDEPMSNLDISGKNMVTEIVEDLRSRTIIIIATNEQKEQELAKEVCRVG